MDSDERRAWTPRLVFWNTLGTVAGAASGLVALVIVLVQVLS